MLFGYEVSEGGQVPSVRRFEGIKGATDGDGDTDEVDARICLQIATGVLEGTAAQREAADVDGDGDVDETDAKILSEYVLGIRATLP